MPPVCHEKPAIRAPALGHAPALAPVTPLNDLFQEFMRSFMERTQAPMALAAPAALATPAAEAKDDTDRPLKLRNPDLYYGHLHMEYYYTTSVRNASTISRLRDR